MNKTAKINNHLRVNGFYIKDVIKGFFGEFDEGNWMLEQMGLPYNVIPFDVADFLRNGETYWKDCNGKIAYMSFKFEDGYLVCFCSYLGRKYTVTADRDTEGTPSEVAHNDSHNIGNTCMQCIAEQMPDCYWI